MCGHIWPKKNATPPDRPVPRSRPLFWHTLQSGRGVPLELRPRSRKTARMTFSFVGLLVLDVVAERLDGRTNEDGFVRLMNRCHARLHCIKFPVGNVELHPASQVSASAFVFFRSHVLILLGLCGWVLYHVCGHNTIGKIRKNYFSYFRHRENDIILTL